MYFLLLHPNLGRARYGSNEIKDIPNATTICNCLIVDNDYAFNYLADSTNFENIIVVNNEIDARTNYMYAIDLLFSSVFWYYHIFLQGSGYCRKQY